MVLQNMCVHTSRGEVKDARRGEHKQSATPVFGKRSRDVARDRAELVEQFNGLRAAVDRDPFDAVVSSRPDGAARVLEQAANTFLVKPRLLTDIDGGASSLTDDSPVVRTDP